MTDKEHTYRVPVQAHANIVVAADSPREAQRIAADSAERRDFSIDSDNIHLEEIELSEDEHPMSDARNVGGAEVEVPSYPNGHALKRAREKIGLTQSDVSQGLGVARSTIAGWENDDSLTLRDARRYAGLLRRRRDD